MKSLLIGAWIVFALDLAILLLMFRELGRAEFGEAERDFAVSVMWRFGLWLCAVNLTLLIGWWRESRAWLWVALAGGALPLLWAWAMAVQAITDAASGTQ